jgi:hypothetical protein
MYEAGGSRHPKFEQKYGDGCCVLAIEKAFDTTWHSGLLYKLEFSTSFIKLIASFSHGRKFKVLVEGEFSMPREITADVPQGSVLAPISYI